MTAKIRNINKQFVATHSTKFQNLLVSGCSFTWNNSENDLCSWPYYLRDLAGLLQVYDCSQAGAGCNHIFNSIVNEIETNDNLNPENTLVIVMWSGMARTDVIATNDITGPWHHMSNYKFDNQFATLSIFNKVYGSSMLDNLCKNYKLLVDLNAQIYESAIKMIALNEYLKSKNYNYLILSWKDPSIEFRQISNPIASLASNTIEPLDYLGEYATRTKQIDNGHPTPNGYLAWTKEYLLPCLVNKGLAANLDTI